jgi:hypothetical protein
MLKDGYCLAESLVLMAYIDEQYPANPLLPPDPLLRARCRLAIDFIDRSICPSFYKYLQEQDKNKWKTLENQLVQHILSFGKQILENDAKYYSCSKWKLIAGSYECLWFWQSIKVSNFLLNPTRKKERSGAAFTPGLTQLFHAQVLWRQKVTKSSPLKSMNDTR